MNNKACDSDRGLGGDVCLFCESNDSTRAKSGAKVSVAGMLRNLWNRLQLGNRSCDNINMKLIRESISAENLVDSEYYI